MKKILSIILAVILGVIATSVLACSFIPKQFNINLTAPDLIKVWNSEDQQGAYLQGSEEYDEIMALYNESFKTTILSALFYGKAFATSSIVDGYQNISTSSLLNADDDLFIEFWYDTVQTVQFEGAEYEEEFDNKYVSIMVEVLDFSSLTQFKAYVRYGEAGTATYSYYRYLTYGIQENLYEYVQSLI